MWDSVRAEPRFIARAEPTLPKSLEEQSEESEGDDTLNDDTAMWPAASAVLALALRIPLFADDRASQVMFWSALKQVRPNAFGTNQMIDALHAEGILSPARAAEAYLKLIRWRYRFIVLPPPVLKTLADQFRNFLPGRHLREVATYVQDSMSDPGLCVGFEPTKVPTSMANSLFHAWIRNVACFLGLVWQDSDYSDDHASSLTRWTVSCWLRQSR